MSEDESKEKPVVVEPVVAEPCDHKGTLVSVSADEAELPTAVERHHNIFRCSKCEEVVVAD